jgi:hypothetical protein
MDWTIFRAWMLGAIKSKLIWLGGVISTMPLWYPQIQDVLDNYLGRNDITAGLGVLVIVLRVVTVRSIPQKGGLIIERKEPDDVESKA